MLAPLTSRACFLDRFERVFSTTLLLIRPTKRLHSPHEISAIAAQPDSFCVQVGSGWSRLTQKALRLAEQYQAVATSSTSGLHSTLVMVPPSRELLKSGKMRLIY